jgi:hypothetical protein
MPASRRWPIQRAKPALSRTLPRLSSATSVAPAGQAARSRSPSRAIRSATDRLRRSSTSRSTSGQVMRFA